MPTLTKKKQQVLKVEELKASIYAALATYKDPYLDADLIVTDCVKEVIVTSCQVIINLQYNFLLGRYLQEVIVRLRNLLEPIIAQLTKPIGVKLILEINCATQVLAHVHKKDIEKIPNIKNIVAVGSGKGGVGKSTIAVNLALSLKEQGAKVGILDADLYGPSLPHMLGCPDRAQINNNKLQPHYAFGLYCISIGHIIAPESPVVWRGPLISGGLLQLLHDTAWPELDYLVVDLPPGTGDIQLTLAQKIPVNAAVIVTTPQTVALLDAQKALLMFQKLEIPILGIIENMSSFICSNCDYQHDIFGTNGGLDMANKYVTRLLGSVPLDLNVRKQADIGSPLVHACPSNSISKIYYEIAMKVAAQLSKLPVGLKLDLSEAIIES